MRCRHDLLHGVRNLDRDVLGDGVKNQRGGGVVGLHRHGLVGDLVGLAVGQDLLVGAQMDKG